LATAGAAAFLAGAAMPAHAQNPAPPMQTVERTTKGAANRDIRIGVYVNVRPDCSSGPLPAIRLSVPPANGKVSVKSANITATNYKRCLALQVPAFVAIYRSNPSSEGIDTLTLDVSYPGGRTEVQKIKVLIGNAAQPGRQI
jgi:hypothetical protein